MSRLTHQAHKDDGVVRLVLVGELDLSSASQVEEVLKDLEAEGAGPAKRGKARARTKRRR